MVIPERTYPEMGRGLNPEGVAEVIAKVADALLAVGALPRDSSLLRRHVIEVDPAWRDELSDQWMASTARFADGPTVPGGRRRSIEGREIGLAVRLPFEHAIFVVEGVGVQSEGAVHLQLFGWPWPRGIYWPVAVRCFDIRAVDDNGAEHVVMMTNGDFVLWPPVSDKARRIRLVVSTPWEAAWADIDLPGR